MGTRLSKAPVCYTLAQMQFDPVPDVERFRPALQDAFRELGFPDFAHAKTQSLEFSANATGMEMKQQEATRLVFRNAAKTAAILLDSAALTYELTDYPDYPEFSRTFLNALETVHHHRPIAYCDRLGMRMLDAVQSLDGKPIDKYLAPQALSLAGLFGELFAHQQTLSESIFTNDGRTLVVRTVRASEGIAVPPDLAPMRLKLDQRFVAHQGETVMLDCDSSNPERTVGFNQQATREELAKLKAALSLCFKTLTTVHARTVWA